jgi:hypothetical protein
VSKLDQQLVPGAVAEAVVYDLEVVQVDEEDRDARLVPAQAGKGKREPVEEERPVRQVGEGVMQDPVGQPVLSIIFSCDRRPCRLAIMG